MFQWNFIWNSKVFIQENAFENIVWETAAILSLPQCVKPLPGATSASSPQFISHLVFTSGAVKQRRDRMCFRTKAIVVICAYVCDYILPARVWFEFGTKGQ